MPPALCKVNAQLPPYPRWKEPLELGFAGNLQGSGKPGPAVPELFPNAPNQGEGPACSPQTPLTSLLMLFLCLVEEEVTGVRP